MLDSKIATLPNGEVGKIFKPVAYQCHINNKENKMLKRIMPFLIVALVAIFGVSSASAASLGSVLPNGLSMSSSVAKQRVQYLVSNDRGVQQSLAADNGISVNDVAASKVAGITKTRVVLGQGYTNTGRTASGSVVPTSYENGQKVISWKVTFHVHKSMSYTVLFKYNCSNPLLHKGSVHVRLLTVVKKAHFWMKFKKSKTTVRTFSCPSGQAVSVKIVTTVSGKVYVSSVTKGVKLISQKLQAKLNEQITNVITAKCGSSPPPPPPHVGCAAGEMQDSNGNCVTQQANCENSLHGSWNNQNQSCTIVNNNCGDTTIVYGNGNTVYTQGNNCNSTPPPDCTTDNSCPSVDHAPQISCVYPAHVFQGGNDYIWCEASDPDGDALTVNIVGDSYGHVSGVIPSDVRWDGTACPAVTSCYRATLWGDNVGTAHITATVTANGVSSTSVGDVPVKQDQF